MRFSDILKGRDRRLIGRVLMKRPRRWISTRSVLPNYGNVGLIAIRCAGCGLQPDESKSKWDFFKVVAVIPGEQAFRPEKEGNCPLVK